MRREGWREEEELRRTGVEESFESGAEGLQLAATPNQSREYSSFYQMTLLLLLIQWKLL